MTEMTEKPRRALLVSAFKGTRERPTCEEHLEELALLARTWGVEVAEKIPVSSASMTPPPL